MDALYPARTRQQSTEDLLKNALCFLTKQTCIHPVSMPGVFQKLDLQRVELEVDMIADTVSEDSLFLLPLDIIVSLIIS